MVRRKAITEMEFIFERPIELALNEQTVEAAIATAISLSEQPYGVTYDPKKTTRFEHEGIIIRVDSKSNPKKIWWEYFLIKNNRILRPNGVAPHPTKLDNNLILRSINLHNQEKFKSIELAINDYNTTFND